MKIFKILSLIPLSVQSRFVPNIQLVSSNNKKYLINIINYLSSNYN